MSHRRKIIRAKKTKATGRFNPRAQTTLYGNKVKRERKNPEWKIICAKCGALDTIPFCPVKGIRYYCKGCYREQMMM